jgi:hypothetical protein
MPIHSELQFGSEYAFLNSYLLPLLQRINQTLVCHYHGRREFGKDLVIAEVDPYGIVRYHAVQVKYAPSIGLGAVEDLIRDCHQAFRNQFRSPSNGQQCFISRFVVVNAGTFSDEARDHFFASLRPVYGDNLGLLDGHACKALEHLAVPRSSHALRQMLVGLYYEVRYAFVVIGLLTEAMNENLGGDRLAPMQRFRINSLETILAQLVTMDPDEINALHFLWTRLSQVNRMLNALDSPMTNETFIMRRSNEVLRSIEKAKDQLVVVEPLVLRWLASLGTLPPENRSTT